MSSFEFKSGCNRDITDTIRKIGYDKEITDNIRTCGNDGEITESFRPKVKTRIHFQKGFSE